MYIAPTEPPETELISRMDRSNSSAAFSPCFSNSLRSPDRTRTVQAADWIPPPLAATRIIGLPSRGDNTSAGDRVVVVESFGNDE